MASRRTTPEYVSEAKRLSEFYPALRKYRGRKRLSQGEKAVIGKAISDWQRRHGDQIKKSRPNYVPLTKAQAKAAGNALPKNTSGQLQMRAIDAPPGVSKSDISVKQGKLAIRSRGQSWQLIGIDFAQDGETIMRRFEREMNKIKRRRPRKARNGLIRFALWTAKGPGAVTRDDQELLDTLANNLGAYQSKEDASEETVFFGLGYEIMEG